MHDISSMHDISTMHYINTMQYISTFTLHAALILTITMHDCVSNSVRTQPQMKKNTGSETNPCEHTI